ncbi:maltase 2-like [Bemisia tabaci]|uniref:maltase 2-like n=1 Tax=Bemisia tabaci TaxID=7038 RepID=UPI003B281421
MIPCISTLCLLILVLLKSNTTRCSFTQIVKPGEKLEWWQTTVIYQILPFSFKDSNGDGIGDFNGITNSMDYFTDTGIGTLWLAPFYKSPMLDAGYDIVDHEQVNPLFGKMADFDKMVKKIKAKGMILTKTRGLTHSLAPLFILMDNLPHLSRNALIKVSCPTGLNLIVDFVPNHTSDQHEWFKKSVRKESPYDDYYIWRDASSWNGSEPVPPNNWVIEVLRFWLNRGIDGVKIDSMAHLAEDPYFRDEPVVQPRLPLYDYGRYNHTHTLNHDENFILAREFRAVLDEYKKRDGKTRLMTVDARGPTNLLMKYCGNDSNVGTHFPMNFNLLDVDHQWKATDLAKAIRATWDNLPPGCWPNWILILASCYIQVSSHDHPRFNDRVGSEMADASNMLTLLLPGTAITYYGDEIGMEDYKALGKEDLAIIDKKDFFRTPFQWDDSHQAGFSTATKTWLPVNPNFWNVNLARAKRDDNSHYKVYKRLVETRQTPTGQYGDLLTYVPSEWVFAFTR